jgi:hypothetical protein
MAPRKKKKVSNPTIYIQIAAYRDPELLNTLRDCLANADHPDRLRFGIAWQHSPYEEWDNLDEFKDDSRFDIIDIDYRDAKGPCWARHQLNKAYNKETYTMQLDSHHRFSKGWDTTVIEMLESLRSKDCPKPLLSSYLPSFDPKNDPAGRMMIPWIMEFDRFAPEGPVHFLPHTIDNFKELDRPMPSRFISGHFIFADGKFCKEVEYDPTYYFHGEEINLSVRAYMAGYDLFAPHRPVIWHEYTREGKKKHWDDHTDWKELDTTSHKHNRTLLGIDVISPSNKLVKKQVRSLEQYELYAGLKFSTRQVHRDTITKKLPPVSIDEVYHAQGLAKYHRMCIDVHRPEFTENDYNVWVIAFENKEGVEIHREDAYEQEIQRILSVPYEQDKFSHIWRNFYHDDLPAKWIVWPHSLSKGWMTRLSGEFNI